MSLFNLYILKRFLLPLAFLVPKLSEAQTSNTPAVSVQSGIMPVNTPYHAHSLMFGMKTSAGDQYLIGPAFKSFIGDVGHKRSYAGLKIHTHVMIGRLAPFLSYEMMWGKYYIYGGDGSGSVGLKSRKQGKGVLGLGYAITDRVNLFAGLAAQDYDPLKYYKSRKTPYKSRGIVLKLSGEVFGRGSDKL